MKLPMTPSRKTQSRWAAEVARVACLALARKQFASGLGLENLGMALHARATACREAVEKYQSGPEVVA